MPKDIRSGQDLFGAFLRLIAKIMSGALRKEVKQFYWFNEERYSSLVTSYSLGIVRRERRSNESVLCAFDSSRRSKAGNPRDFKRFVFL